MNVLSLFDGISCGYLALQRAGIKFDNYFASEIDKYCIEISKYNFPDIIQLGDVKKLDTSKLPEIEVLLAGFPCFAEGTKIITKNGYKNIEDIRVGDYVYTHKGRYKKVLNTQKKKNKIWKLKSQGTIITETTAEHPYYIRKILKKPNKKNKKYKKTISEPVWVKVNELIKNQYLAHFPIINIEENPLNLNKELCWLLGRYVADGYIIDSKRKNRKNSYNYKTIICVGEKKTDIFESNIQNIKYTKNKNKTVYKYTFCSKDLLSLIKKINLGRGAINKRIPQEILHLPKCLAKSFLDGYMSGDGCFYKEEYSANSISKELCMGLNLLIAKVYNVNSTICYYKRPKTTIIDGRIVNQKDTYSVKFFTKIKKKSKAKIKENFIFLPIKKIEETNEIKNVYNIEVEQDNSYYANNLCVHNCQSFSIAGNRKGFEDERGNLFFDLMRIMKETKPKYFLFENVASMKKSYREKLDELIGVKSIVLNSSLVSAQQRKRLYWCNWNVEQPKDKEIYLKDIIEEDGEGIIIEEYGKKIIRKTDKSHCLMSRDYKGFGKQRTSAIKKPIRIGQIRNAGQGQRIYDIKGKSVCLSAKGGGQGAKTGLYDIKDCIRKLTPIECERLQTLHDNFTAKGIIDGKVVDISDTRRYMALGNCWTVDIIVHILKAMPKLNFELK